jgi:replication factor C subunit 1
MKDQNWELAPLHGTLSMIRPCFFVRGSVQGMLAFPSFLGKTSTTNKRYRLLRELQVHMNARANASKFDVALDYMDVLKNHLALPLVLRGEEGEGIDEVIATMESYGLMREDWDTVMELTAWHDANDPSKEHISKRIDSNVKSAFTRKYNSEHHSIIVGSSTQGGRAPNLLYEIPEAEADENLAPDEGEESDDEEGGAEGDIKKDRLIKKKAKPKGGAKKKKSDAKAGEEPKKPKKKKPKTEKAQAPKKK